MCCWKSIRTGKRKVFLCKNPLPLKREREHARSFALKVKKKSKSRATHEQFCKALPKKTAIYALYDLALKTRDGRRINKAYLVCWTPKSCNTEYKVMYTSQRGKLVGEFDGLKLCNASSLKELDSELGIEDESDSDDDEWDPDA